MAQVDSGGTNQGWDGMMSAAMQSHRQTRRGGGIFRPVRTTSETVLPKNKSDSCRGQSGPCGPSLLVISLLGGFKNMQNVSFWVVACH